ncbi:MAG: hypothetical protein ACR2LR_13740 [Hassallia sp.]
MHPAIACRTKFAIALNLSNESEACELDQLTLDFGAFHRASLLRSSPTRA